MREISRIAVAATALVCIGIGCAPQIWAQDNPYDTVVDTRMGRRLFQAECGRCHGLDGKGNDETGAPDLTTGNYSSASSDRALFEVIRDGVSGTTMVGISWAPEHRIWQVVTYLRSLNPQFGDYELSGNADNGARLFTGTGDCTRCHMVGGQGGRLGPDLSIVGNRMTPDELRTAMTEPDETVEPRWWTMKVVRSDGSPVEGLRMSEDTFTLRLMDENENLWHLSKKALRSVERDETSPMPAVTETLSSSEVDDLIAYLFSLRKES